MTAPLSTFDMADGGPLESGDVETTPRALSVAEIQQVLREVRARCSLRPTRPVDSSPPRPREGNSQQLAVNSEGPAQWGDRAAGTWQRRGDIAELQVGWVAILAAHSGAGASMVALVVSEAAAADGRRVYLIDPARPFRSGLLAAAREELGPDVTGAWRRGVRTGITIDRRAGDTAPGRWPVPPVGDDSALTVVDLGLAAPGNLTRLAADRTRSVVVCRPTVPGVRQTEQLLEQLAGQPVVVAAVGLTRWPGEVSASLGPRLRALRAAGRVVPVSMDRRLQVTGPTSSPLPRALRAAGRPLLELLDDSHPGTTTRSSAPTTEPVSTPEDTRR